MAPRKAPGFRTQELTLGPGHTHRKDEAKGNEWEPYTAADDHRPFVLGAHTCLCCQTGTGACLDTQAFLGPTDGLFHKEGFPMH